MKLTLKELGVEYGSTLNISGKKSQEAIRELFAILSDNLHHGHEINIPDFGKFKVKQTSERAGRNPKTGEATIIPAKRKVVFTPAKTLKEKVGS